MLVEITVSAETSKSVPDVAINGPSKGVLDRSTPLNGGHIYSDNDDDGTLSRFGRIGRESEQIAPPAFLVTRPRCEHRLGKKRSQISLCISESPSAGGARFLCVSRRAPRRGVHPKMDHIKVYLTEVHLYMGVTSIGTPGRQRFRHGSRPNRANSYPSPIFDYETLLTPSFGKKSRSPRSPGNEIIIMLE